MSIDYRPHSWAGWRVCEPRQLALWRVWSHHRSTCELNKQFLIAWLGSAARWQAGRSKHSIRLRDSDNLLLFYSFTVCTFHYWFGANAKGHCGQLIWFSATITQIAFDCPSKSATSFGRIINKCRSEAGGPGSGSYSRFSPNCSLSTQVEA